MRLIIQNEIIHYSITFEHCNSVFIEWTCVSLRWVIKYWFRNCISIQIWKLARGINLIPLCRVSYLWVCITRKYLHFYGVRAVCWCLWEYLDYRSGSLRWPCKAYLKTSVSTYAKGEEWCLRTKEFHKRIPSATSGGRVSREREKKRDDRKTNKHNSHDAEECKYHHHTLVPLKSILVCIYSTFSEPTVTCIFIYINHNKQSTRF